MIYMGSKNKIAKDILKIILKTKSKKNYLIDAFCGGGNFIKNTTCTNKVALDINKYTIAFLNKIKKDTDWIPKTNKEFTEADYRNIQNNKDLYPDYFVAHVGYNLSYGGKWFGGYAHNNSNKDYVEAAYKHTILQAQLIQDVDFINCSYDEFNLPNESIIYCDIPYRNTTDYSAVAQPFNYDEFYSWCKRKRSDGHHIYIGI